MGSSCTNFYKTTPHIPAEIIVEVEPDDRTVLQAWLKEKRKAAVSIVAPKRGEKLGLVEMVKQTASEVLEQPSIKWLSESQRTPLALEEIQAASNLADQPY